MKQVKKLDIFPELETDRLKLRQLELSDAETILEIRSQKEMLTYIEMYQLKSLDDAMQMILTNRKKFKDGKGLIWGIEFKENKELIGYLGYHTIVPENFQAEVCYLILPNYWNQGLIKEAMNCITPFAFNEMNLNRLDSVIMFGNDSSVKVAENAGYRKEAHFKENVYYEGKFYDYLIYAMLRSDFIKNN
jgi:RimJ/RimL family protein N-acetyltransferase